MTIDDLAGLLEAHEHQKIKKKHESFHDQLLQKNMIVEEEDMYVQRSKHGREIKEHGRERNFGGRGSSRGSGRGLGKYVRSGCTTALNVVPWETDSESVLRESC
ncbi:hypothetical protein Tco_0127967 [Tanacetum coccineum]